MKDQSTKVFRNLLILGGVFSFILIGNSAIQGGFSSGGDYIGGSTTVGRRSAGFNGWRMRNQLGTGRRTAGW
tara:strand:+ start:3855 stop:4070 length:216 start_codon:yes stop_codon:yes gene_type:complete